jgi:hypothetical protein
MSGSARLANLATENTEDWAAELSPPAEHQARECSEPRSLNVGGRVRSAFYHLRATTRLLLSPLALQRANGRSSSGGLCVS